MADSIIVQADGTIDAYMAKAREICEANVRNLNNCRYVSFRQRAPSRAKPEPKVLVAGYFTSGLESKNR